MARSSFNSLRELEVFLLYSDAWKRAWKTALKKSGIAYCRFHDLRHTFVSNLVVGEKEDLTTVMELSGHKDIRMLKRYSHTGEEAKRTAIGKLEERLNRAVIDTSLDTSSSIYEYEEELNVSP
ncbi:Tyrosine recombinase XerC [bacterium HR37]|nr:Tyrosine recombinase XerC [bacterium HR37]